MKPVPVQIAFRSNPAKYEFAGNTRLLNAYAEDQGKDAKSPLAVLPCPGAVSCATVTDTPGRGLIFLDDQSCAYAVHSSGVFKVTQSSSSPFTLTATRIGTVPGTDQVVMHRNQADPVQISIDCNAGQFYIEADSVKTVDPDQFTTAPVTSEHAGGYTIYGEENGRFDYSTINAAQTVDPLDFATAEQYADKLVRIKSDGSDVFMFSRTSIEPWRITSDAALPFQLIGGSVSKKGIVAKHGVVSCDNTLMFPGEDNIVYRLNGYTPQRISTHGIERKLENDADRESITSFAYSFEGHSFAGWTSTDYTISYDAATGLFHDRQSYQLNNYRFRNHVRAWGKTVCQDSQTGKLFYLDGDTYDEDGSPMVWGIDTPFLNSPTHGGIVDALYIDVATGYGALNATDDGYRPKMMVSWSVDGGYTFKGNREVSLGVRGDRVRVVVRRLGRFDDMGIMFRIRISDPVVRAILSMDAKVRPLIR